MFCPKCVAQNPDSNKFCGQCGTQIIESDHTGLIPRVGFKTEDFSVAPLDKTAVVNDNFEASKYINVDHCRSQLDIDHTLLVELQGPSAGATYLLTHPEETVGRNPNSHIFLDDVTVSRRHCVFRTDVDTHQLYVVECGSLNGTFVNNVETEESVLKDGDIVRIGKFRLQVLRSHSISPDTV